ncbi:hypothetical protein FC99_GL001508 [Levilactobacillus koreensis JCM 16448]|nr:hypothetical protein FC99_GL001508 [Levilactobacillus koreensis JCM 16448]
MKTWVFHGFKSSEKPVSQAEASPQQAESLAAVARKFSTNKKTSTKWPMFF